MNLIERLQQVPEFRAARGQRHPLWLVLLLIILGAMMGYWGYRPLAEFVATYGEELRGKLKLAKETKLPSYSTFRRVMQQLDFHALAAVFTDWAQTHTPVELGEWLAMDGKSIRSSVTDYDSSQQNFVSLVSLFSHQRGVVQAVMPMQNKVISEQEVVRLLLAAVEIKGVGVTLDALHTQKTLQQIIGQQNDYLVCVKTNQQRLYEWIEQQWQTSVPCSIYQEQEQSHGRIVSRRTLVFDSLGEFAQEWVGLQRCIVVERQGTRDGQAFSERQFYISSVATTAQQFHTIIRGHWAIENQLHWVKDVTFDEDHAPQRGKFAAANWSVVRNFFITIARSLGFTSIATAKRLLANQLDKIFPLLQ